MNYKKCCNTKKLKFQKKLTLIKQMDQKKCVFCHYWYFKDVGFEFEPHVCDTFHDILMTTYELKTLQY